MLAAHMDEIGFMVRYIDESGWLRVQPLGGFDPRVLVAQRVLVTRAGGRAARRPQPAEQADPPARDEKPEAAKLEEFYVDLGLPADAVTRAVRIGDFVTMDRTFEQLGDRVIGKAMDDRAGVFTMIEALRARRCTRRHVYAVATVQEEVGLRGAGDLGLHRRARRRHRARCDAGAGYSRHAARADAVTRLGDGAAIKVMDSSFISHPKLVAALPRHRRAPEHPAPDGDAAARRHRRGGDAAGARRRGGDHALDPHALRPHGQRDGGLGDLDAASTLLARYLEEAHNGDYTL